MKTLALILSLTLVASLTEAANVTFNLTDFLGTVQTLQRKPVLVEPLSTVRANVTNLVMSEPRYFTTGTNGIFTATNMNEGEYRVRVFGANKTNLFRINVPDTNGTINASGILLTGSTTALETEEGQTIDLE